VLALMCGCLASHAFMCSISSCRLSGLSPMSARAFLSKSGGKVRIGILTKTENVIS